MHQLIKTRLSFHPIISSTTHQTTLLSQTIFHRFHNYRKTSILCVLNLSMVNINPSTSATTIKNNIVIPRPIIPIRSNNHVNQKNEEKEAHTEENGPDPFSANRVGTLNRLGFGET
ncbi:hypothetical protein AAHE18_20G003900 [Arachis hypogaea]